MKHKFIYGLALILALVGIVVISIFNPFGVDRVGLAQAAIAEMDFEIVGGRIYVPAEVNGHKTSVLLDTGTGASLMDLELANQWALPSKGEVTANGTGSEPVKGKVLNDVTVKFGSITEPIPYAIPLGSIAEAEGRRLEVIIGYHFFQTHIVEIDYSKHHLRIFDGRADLGKKGVIIPLHFAANLPHMTAEMLIGGTKFKLEAMVDTGGTNTDLTAKFLKGHSLQVTSTARTVVAGGVGGYSEGRFFRPDSVRLGSVDLVKPILALTETAGGGAGEQSLYDMGIGFNLLRRFRVTFDYPHRQMILEAGVEIAKPFEADKTGLSILAQGPGLDVFRVAGVLTGSSAEKAGLKVDDIIETVDGAPLAKVTLQQLRELFKSQTATKWELGIRRGDQQLTLTLPARSVI
jgi:predicted aspartyl protease